MERKQQILFGTILSLIVLFSGISYYLVTVEPFKIDERTFEIGRTLDIETNAQRLSAQIDDSDNQHMIYLIGGRPRIEPNGEETFGGVSYVSSHVLKYGLYDGQELHVENITDDLVFPYHYDLRIDSLGQVHTAFVAGNYTLYYAIRDTAGQWEFTILSQSDEMFAMMPAITLGTDEQPRIVYTVLYTENGNDFFNQTGDSIRGLFSVHYYILNGSNWLNYDIGNNHAPSYFSQLSFAKRYTFNPGIKIEDGMAYIFFTNKVKTAGETRMNYLKIPEIPSNVTNFDIVTHHRAIVAVSPSTTYRRPNIHILGEGIAITYGAWQFGGASVAFLTNSSVLEDPDVIIAREQWQTEYLMDQTKLNRQIESLSSVEQNGTITVTWTLFDLSDQGKLLFSHDVFVASFIVNDGVEIGAIDISRVTDTNQIHHYSPNLIVTGSDEMIIFYLAEDEDGTETKLETSIKAPLVLPYEDEGLAFLMGIIFVGIFITISVILIKLIPKVEEEIVILPHMINLKDEISEH